MQSAAIFLPKFLKFLPTSCFSFFQYVAYLGTGLPGNGKIANDVIHLARKEWLTKSYKLCWKGIGRTSIFGVVLITIMNIVTYKVN